MLREAERVLTGEGCLMICGFNPFSGWGARRVFGQYFGRPAFPPHTQRMLSERRLRDWVALLGFDVDSVHGYLGFLPMKGGLRRGPIRGVRLDGGRLLAQGAQARVDSDPDAAAPAGAPAGAGAAPRNRPTKWVHDRSRDLHRRRVPRQSRARRLGGTAGLRQGAQGSLRMPKRRPPTTAWNSCAAIGGLGALKRRCAVKLYTDSKYVLQGITEWLPNWKARGWRTAAREPVKNQDLWELLDAAAATQDIRMAFGSKGHSGHEGNEYVDQTRQRCDRSHVGSAVDSRMRQVVLDTETTGLEVEQAAPHHRNRLRGALQPAADRPLLPPIFESRARHRRRRGSGARFDARAAGEGTDFCARACGVSGVHPRRRTDHPQCAVRRGVSERGACAHRRFAAPRRPTCAACSTPWRSRGKCIPDSATAWMRCASATRSTTRIASITARCSTRASSPKCIWR